jgi:hypothetical protein
MTVEIKIKQVKLSEIKLNPDNPRTISKLDMDLLVKSLQEFPDMLKMREIIVDEKMIVLGGNMRLLALQKIGTKDATAKIVTGLTKEQKREFIVKDNASMGEWNFDDLANSWSDLPLAEWGVDIPASWQNDEPVAEAKEESERYKLIFDFEKDDASFVQTALHKDLTKNKQEMDDHWRERCLLRLLKKLK